MNEIQIKVGANTLSAKLLNNETADQIRDVLPIKGRVKRWGDEIYFNIPVNIKQDKAVSAEVSVGDLAYWPPGNTFCIFFGPTPSSVGNQPMAASPVHVFGNLASEYELLSDVRDQSQIEISLTEG